MAGLRAWGLAGDGFHVWTRQASRGKTVVPGTVLALCIFWRSPTCVAVFIAANIVLLRCLRHVSVVSSWLENRSAVA